MNWLPNLTARNLQPELMDQPDLDAAAHRQALAGLGRINRWSGSVRIVWPAVRQLARRSRTRQLRLLDVASGGGDVPIGLWRRARRAGVHLEIVGCDFSSLAVETATAQAARCGANVHFQVHDVLRDPLPSGFDVVMSSLFLHHLTSGQAVSLLEKMASATGHLLLINDLRRSTSGYLLAQAACHTLTRSRIVRVDGPRSVAGAFTISEVRSLFAHAKLDGAVIQKRWPFRFLLSWHK
jgi:2-polyprenyl-3-methyl-5-hydroxy-6-metoxy-1,4-benzoquinol methylase